MATFNPQYVNLNPYEAAQINRRANMVSPLDAALQGLDQGIRLGQLPQTLQDQALARQLNNALNQQKLMDLQNPEAALVRQLTRELTLKGALNPDLGIQAAPAGLVGQTIANPGAITAAQQAALPSNETLALRDIARAAGGVDIPTVIPTAQAGLTETPISAFGIQTGLNTNPNIPLDAKQAKLDAQIAAINARPELFRPLATEQGLFNVGSRSNQAVPLLSPTGEQLTAPPRATGVRGAAGARPLTEGQKTSLLLRVGKSGINPNDFVKEDGTYEFDKMAVAAGSAERSIAEESRKAKLTAIPAELRSKAAGYVAVQKDLEDLKSEVLDLQKNGQIPSSVDNAIAAATATTPGGFFGSLYQAGLKSFQSADSKEFEGTKARVATSLTNMISGAAVPENERQFLTPFLPVLGESFETLVGKLSGLEKYLNNRISSFSSGSSATPSSQISPGTRVFQGGKTYIFDGKTYNEVK